MEQAQDLVADENILLQILGVLNYMNDSFYFVFHR